ncbi:serine carboxypeptidase 3-like [Olea europaea var. sylvestris]|uniref:serine carboxypeptidase 3-like n=1 Tax=Olea europaea var. sylvestris TaxID=158386 RepID=UPI000C1CF213|nr:serine carboxypeptidase 3-like [Olea europaea var. sylvestris]
MASSGCKGSNCFGFSSRFSNQPNRVAMLIQVFDSKFIGLRVGVSYTSLWTWMFYFFFESRNSKEDPIVIWLTGGPGCSSEMALFYENGPFTIANNLSLVWNEYGWDKVSNILYVDQPTGTGFSYSSDRRDIRHDEKGVSNDLYDFLQVSFDLFFFPSSTLWSKHL